MKNILENYQRKGTICSHHTYHPNQHKKITSVLVSTKVVFESGSYTCMLNVKTLPQWIWNVFKWCRVLCSHFSPRLCAKHSRVLSGSWLCETATGNYSHASTPTVSPCFSVLYLNKVQITEDASSKSPFQMWGSNWEKLSAEYSPTQPWRDAWPSWRCSCIAGSPARQATLWMTKRKSSSGSNSFTRPSSIDLSPV